MNSNQIRIIGGQWRGRKLKFPSLPDLRPTPDRVRETAFSWLMNDIGSASCLDLFAGSGALGFEALSRGASDVTFIDLNKKVIEQLQKNAELFHCQNEAKIILNDAHGFLNQTKNKYDLIFLDPPFKLNLVSELLQLVVKTNCLNDAGLIYFEIENNQHLDLPPSFLIRKEKRAGSVTFGLIEKQNEKQ